jgi:hypothetical protein
VAQQPQQQHKEGKMSEPTNADILLAIGRLEGGVLGINQRLDTLNGRTARTEIRLSDIELSRAKEKGYMAGIASVVSIAWGVVVAYFTK